MELRLFEVLRKLLNDACPAEAFGGRARGASDSRPPVSLREWPFRGCVDDIGAMLDGCQVFGSSAG